MPSHSDYRFPQLAVMLIASVAVHAAANAAILDREVTFRVVDAQSATPVPKVFAAMEESSVSRAYAPAHSSSISTCIRSGAGQGNGRDTTFILKSTGGLSLGLANSSRFAVYAPGYCVSGPKSGAVDYEFEATRSTDPPEHRLLELASLAVQFQNVGVCAEQRAPEADAALAAILVEAKSVATTSHERYLASLLDHRITRAGPEPRHARGRGFAIVDEEAGEQSPSWSISNTQSPGPSSAPIGKLEGGPPKREPGPPRYRVVCRDGQDCDFERRGAGGQTYLLELIARADVERASVLLAAGANPDAQTHPGGPTGLDFLLDRLRNTSAVQHFERAGLMISALARDGRATIDSNRLETWRARRISAESPQLAAAVARITEDLATLRPRPAYTPVCPIRSGAGFGRTWHPYMPDMYWPAR